MKKVVLAGVFAISFTLFLGSQEAFAANILFVGDDINDVINIPAALTAQGHTVTVVANDYNAGANPTLLADNSQFDAIYWSATGGGTGAAHNFATMTVLTIYANNGGCVFVTGYDSIASPTDTNLITFLGGAGSVDVPPQPQAIVNIANALTVGVRDIRTLTPSGGSPDMDNLLEALDADTIGVAPGFFAGQWAWTLKEPAGTTGKIAYVSNGRATFDNGDGAFGEEDNWLITANDVTGVYNAALLNFALACSEVLQVGGEYFTLDTTALLVAGLQTNLAWIIPVLAAAGIGAVVLRKKF